MSNSMMLKDLTRDYKRRFQLLFFWDGLNYGLLFSLAPALFSVFYDFTPRHYLLFPICLLSGFIMKLPGAREGLYPRLDRLTGSDGGIVTVADLLGKQQANPYLPLLFERVRRQLSENPAWKCFPLKGGRRAVKTLALSGVLLLLLFFTSHLKPERAGFREILRNTSHSLAEAAERDSRFVPLSENLSELEAGLTEEDELPDKIPELKELSRELTRQIQELERNSLSRFFEERGQTRSDVFEHLSRGEATVPETREFIMDLLSDSSVDEDARRSIRKSFSDYSGEDEGRRETSRDAQKKLSEELIGALDPEVGELAGDLKDILEDLQSLSEDRGAAGSYGTPEGLMPGEHRPDAAEPKAGAAEANTATAGTMPGKTGEEGPLFVPWEGESPQARLPEGFVRKPEEQGILRLEGSENFSLQRISPEGYTGERLAEEEIPFLSLPDEIRTVVRDYFTAIGSETDN